MYQCTQNVTGPAPGQRLVNRHQSGWRVPKQRALPIPQNTFNSDRCSNRVQSAIIACRSPGPVTVHCTMHTEQGKVLSMCALSLASTVHTLCTGHAAKSEHAKRGKTTKPGPEQRVRHISHIEHGVWESMCTGERATASSPSTGVPPQPPLPINRDPVRVW